MPLPTLTPIPPVNPYSSPDFFLGVPSWIWLLLVAVIIVQGIAFIRRRR